MKVYAVSSVMIKKNDKNDEMLLMKRLRTVMPVQRPVSMVFTGAVQATLITVHYKYTTTRNLSHTLGENSTVYNTNEHENMYCIFA